MDNNEIKDNAVLAGLLAVQRELVCPKNQYNSFGKYKYRNCEDILSAARPLCNDNGLVLTLKDEPFTSGEWHYIKATVTVTDVVTGTSFSTDAFARESTEKKGMDSAQVTGATSSYARKYALCAMFAIDDTKDVDSEEYQSHNTPRNAQNSPRTVSEGQGNINTPTDRNAAVYEAIIAKQAKLNISNGALKNIIRRHFKKDGYKELTLEQREELSYNLHEWSEEK